MINNTLYGNISACVDHPVRAGGDPKHGDTHADALPWRLHWLIVASIELPVGPIVFGVILLLFLILFVVLFEQIVRKVHGLVLVLLLLFEFISKLRLKFVGSFRIGIVIYLLFCESFAWILQDVIGLLNFAKLLCSIWFLA